METRQKVLVQRLGPGIPVGLKNDHKPLVRPCLFDCLQGRHNLRRMVPVVINHRHFLLFALELHSSLHALVTLQSHLNSLKRQFEFESDTDCGQGIVNIMLARRSNGDFS